MEISRIFVSQRKLRNVGQLAKMVVAIKSGGFLPRIKLCRCEDGSIQVEDGHHRLTAFWLAGFTKLRKDDYELYEKDRWRPRFGTIEDLIDRCDI